ATRPGDWALGVGAAAGAGGVEPWWVIRYPPSTAATASTATMVHGRVPGGPPTMRSVGGSRSVTSTSLPRSRESQRGRPGIVGCVTEMTWLDATAQAELVRRGEVSPKELVEGAIARIESVNPRLDAVIRERFEQARVEAFAELPD